MGSNPTICEENWQQVIQIEEIQQEVVLGEVAIFNLKMTFGRILSIVDCEGVILLILSVDGCIKYRFIWFELVENEEWFEISRWTNGT